MVRVKICGITSPTDAKMCIRLGADALGFNFVRGPRKVTKERAKAIIETLPPFVTSVGLFADAEVKTIDKVCSFCGIRTVQLHGYESPKYVQWLSDYEVVKAFAIRDRGDLRRLARYEVAAYLLDTFAAGEFGGTGESFDWEIVREARVHGPIIVAGGLTPDNVDIAVEVAQPYGVDVASGVECEPGKKDRTLVRDFVRTAKEINGGGY